MIGAIYKLSTFFDIIKLLLNLQLLVINSKIKWYVTSTSTVNIFPILLLYLLKGIYPEFQVIRGLSQKIPADLLSYDKIQSYNWPSELILRVIW